MITIVFIEEIRQHHDKSVFTDNFHVVTVGGVDNGFRLEAQMIRAGIYARCMLIPETVDGIEVILASKCDERIYHLHRLPQDSKSEWMSKLRDGVLTHKDNERILSYLKPLWSI